MSSEPARSTKNADARICNPNALRPSHITQLQTTVSSRANDGERAAEWGWEEAYCLARRAQYHMHAQQRVGARGACVTRLGSHPPPSLPFLQHPVDHARLSACDTVRRSIDGGRSGEDGERDESGSVHSVQEMVRRWGLPRHVRAVSQRQTQRVG